MWTVAMFLPYLRADKPLTDEVLEWTQQLCNITLEAADAKQSPVQTPRISGAGEGLADLNSV